MSQRVNPELKEDLLKYGVKDWNDCFHCGTCTATCNLTDESFAFPRKEIKYLQMGLKNKVAQSVEPWLCYYCGDCSEQCLREAEPGELMMSLRRYLMSLYDWTGISGLFYRNKLVYILSFFIVGIAIMLVAFSTKYDINEWKSTFEFGHLLEQLFVAGVAILIILPSVFRMYWFAIVKDKTIKVSFIAYITSLCELFLHSVTQKNILKCSNSTFTWFRHWIVAVSYIVMLVMVVIFDWFQFADGIGTGAIIGQIIAYLVFGLLTIFSGIMIIKRIAKKEEQYKFSELSDWFFPIWLFLLALTATLSFLTRQLGIINVAQLIFIIHIIIIAQWALLIVPFTKWAHILYRPFGIYFACLKKSSKLVK